MGGAELGGPTPGSMGQTPSLSAAALPAPSPLCSLRCPGRGSYENEQINPQTNGLCLLPARCCIGTLPNIPLGLAACSLALPPGAASKPRGRG